MDDQRFEADTVLRDDPDCPSYGLNLTCAWPLPNEVRDSYEDLAAQLSALDGGLYVYPHRQTHITLVTLVSFMNCLRPDENTLGQLVALGQRINGRLTSALLDWCPRGSFQLIPDRLRLSPRAATLECSNPGGEVRELRQGVLTNLRADPELYAWLLSLGFRIPDIIHTTVLRFVRPPRFPDIFADGFDAVGRRIRIPPFEVRQVLFSAETLPYMRRGEVLAQFSL